LEALAALGEDPDRRSLDCAAGDGVGVASIAFFVSSVKQHNNSFNRTRNIAPLSSSS
jgi:hypothetical protein